MLGAECPQAKSPPAGCQLLALATRRAVYGEIGREFLASGGRGRSARSRRCFLDDCRSSRRERWTPAFRQVLRLQVGRVGGSAECRPATLGNRAPKFEGGHRLRRLSDLAKPKLVVGRALAPLRSRPGIAGVGTAAPRPPILIRTRALSGHSHPGVWSSFGTRCFDPLRSSLFLHSDGLRGRGARSSNQLPKALLSRRGRAPDVGAPCGGAGLSQQRSRPTLQAPRATGCRRDGRPDVAGGGCGRGAATGGVYCLDNNDREAKRSPVLALPPFVDRTGPRSAGVRVAGLAWRFRFIAVARGAASSASRWDGSGSRFLARCLRHVTCDPACGQR